MAQPKLLLYSMLNKHPNYVKKDFLTKCTQGNKASYHTYLILAATSKEKINKWFMALYKLKYLSCQQKNFAVRKFAHSSKLLKI